MTDEKIKMGIAKIMNISLAITALFFKQKPKKIRQNLKIKVKKIKKIGVTFSIAIFKKYHVTSLILNLRKKWP